MVGHVIGTGLSSRTVSNIAPVNTINNIAHMNGGTCGGATLTRPRPQPIAGTPPPDPNEKCDTKMIQQTCNLFGLDLVHIFLVYSMVKHFLTSKKFYLHLSNLKKIINFVKM